MKMFDNRNILLITVGFFFVFCGFDGAQSYLVALLKANGHENQGLYALVLLYAVFFFANIYAPAVIGVLGPRLAIVLGAVPYVLFSLAIALGISSLLFAMSIAVGLGAALLWNSSGQIVSLASSPTRMGTNSGLKYSALFVGGFLGTALGGYLLTRVSLAALYGCFAILTSLGVLAFCAIKIGPQPKQYAGIMRIGLLTNPKILLLAPAVIANYFVMLLAISGMKILVLERFDLEAVAFAGTSLKLGAMVGSIAMGKLADRYDGARFLPILALIGIAGIVLFVVAGNLPLIVVASLCVATFFSGCYPVVQQLLRSRSDDGEFNMANGAFHVYGTFGMLSGLLASLWLAPVSALMIGALSLLAVFPSVAVFARRYPRVTSNAS